MRWPPWRRETRADSSYTDALVASITANASGATTAFPTATAALEACAGFVGRAFAAAEVATDARTLEVLTPAVLSMIGRALIRRGEVVLLIRVVDGRLVLLPAASHDVDGGPDPSTWRYRCTVGGPERTVTFDRVDGARHHPHRLFNRPRATLAWPRAVAGSAARGPAVGGNRRGPRRRGERASRRLLARAGRRRRPDDQHHQGRHP